MEDILTIAVCPIGECAEGAVYIRTVPVAQPERVFIFGKWKRKRPAGVRRRIRARVARAMAAVPYQKINDIFHVRVRCTPDGVIVGDGAAERINPAEEVIRIL